MPELLNSTNRKGTSQSPGALDLKGPIPDDPCGTACLFGSRTVKAGADDVSQRGPWLDNSDRGVNRRLKPARRTPTPECTRECQRRWTRPAKVSNRRFAVIVVPFRSANSPGYSRAADKKILVHDVPHFSVDTFSDLGDPSPHALVWIALRKLRHCHEPVGTGHGIVSPTRGLLVTSSHSRVATPNFGSGHLAGATAATETHRQTSGRAHQLRE